MGCGGSSGFAYGRLPPNLTLANGGCTSGVGEITRARTGFVLEMYCGSAQDTAWNRYSVRDGDASGYDIKDHNGRVVYKVLSHNTAAPTMANYIETALSRSMMHIADASDQRVAVLERCVHRVTSGIQGLASMGFILYSYAPNFDGQQSTKADRNGAALFPYACFPDPEGTVVGRLPEAANEKKPSVYARLFQTSNSEDDAVCLLYTSPSPRDRG